MGQTRKIASTGRPAVSLPRLALLLALLLVSIAVLGGCGLKTPPRPAVQVLPPTLDFKVRQREEGLLVSWRFLARKAAARFGGVRGFRLHMKRHPVFCAICPAEEERRLEVRPGGKGLHQEGNLLVLRIPLESKAPAPVLWRVRMVTVFGSGENRPTPVILVEPPPSIPIPRLLWRWADGQPSSQGAGQRPALLAWGRAPEGIVQVIGEEGRPRPMARFFLANLYRRNPPGPWPLLPLNQAPLDSAIWPLEVSSGGGGQAGEHSEYVLRWVDHFGNEGPPSPPVIPGVTEPAP